MQIVEDLPQGLRYPIMTIGVFDGLHFGHQEILRRLVARATEKNGTSVLLTFTPHPQKIISPVDAPPLLQTFSQKAEMLSGLGIDVMVRLPFTRKLSLYSPEQFAKKILHCHGIREVYVGRNFRFGHRRKGDFHTLGKLGRESHFSVHPIEPVRLRGIHVSSTTIRQALKEGLTSLARRLLDRPYQIRGTVVRGSGRGSTIGYPTVNLDPENELVPATGVYVTRALVDGVAHWGGTNIGYRPTVDSRHRNRPLVESHLFNLDRNLYGKSIGLEFFFRLRSEKKFDGVESLKQQIDRDILLVRKYAARAQSLSNSHALELSRRGSRVSHQRRS